VTDRCLLVEGTGEVGTKMRAVIPHPYTFTRWLGQRRLEPLMSGSRAQGRISFKRVVSSTPLFARGTAMDAEDSRREGTAKEWMRKASARAPVEM